MTATVLSGLILVAVVGLLLTVPRTTATGVRDSLSPTLVAPLAGHEAMVLSADSLAPLVNRDPFRLSRTPAAVRYDPLGTVVEASPPPAPRPQLILTGILWGPRPTAVIEGILGTDGPRLVRPGDVINGFRVVRILRDGLTVRGADTTWNLTIREPWR